MIVKRSVLRRLCESSDTRYAVPMVEQLTWDGVLRWRLRQHHLTGALAPDAIAVARRVCGVHAQLAASATTAIGLRSPAEILAVDGRIVGVWTGDRRGDTLRV